LQLQGAVSSCGSLEPLESSGPIAGLFPLSHPEGSIPMNRIRFTTIILGAALFGLNAVACGGAAVPHSELSTAQAAVRAAEVGGAAEDPQAELRLKNARDKIAEAEALIKEGDNEEATWKLREAESDAELASALAQQTKAKAEADAAIKRIKQLMEETKV
jgi:hypothetical protein